MITLPSKNLRKVNGAVYTPENLAQYLAKKTLKYYLQDTPYLATNPINKLKILDPACGDGILLSNSWQALRELCLVDRKYQDAKEVLCGLDIDLNAIKGTKKCISELSENRNDAFNLIHTNALLPINSITSAKGWEEIKKQYNAPKGFDLVVANPPWGADITAYKNNLSKSEFALLQGQFDSADLFVELALSITKLGGYFAFILPDSLFGQERKLLRKMLLSKTEIKFIGRFGEKIFEGVNRACAIIICKNQVATTNHKIDCLRLTPDLRTNIIQGNINFEIADSRISHTVLQKRFLMNKGFIFDIDVKENEQVTLFRINTTKHTFGNYLTSTRGIELSKKGEIAKCPYCSLWLPKPTSFQPICIHCKKKINLKDLILDKIVKEEAYKNYSPLIVGENLKRYKINGTRWIEPTREGISYKNHSIYSGPKILVRKTGVGITATMDYSHALTNQVVYIFKRKEDATFNFALEFFLAIMNSRAIYYYLAKSYGETEWRSHPYLSQKQVLDLPLPKIDFTQIKNMSKIFSIVKLVKPYLLKNVELPNEVDAKIENLVASLYGLNKKNYELIYQTLDSSENLLPVKMLKNISLTNIFSN